MRKNTFSQIIKSVKLIIVPLVLVIGFFIAPTPTEAGYCGTGTWSCCYYQTTSCYNSSFNTCALGSPGCNCFTTCGSQGSDSCANSCPSDYGCTQDALGVYLGCSGGSAGDGSYSSGDGGYGGGGDGSYESGYIPPPTDLQVTSFKLTDSGGNAKTTFLPTDQIYVKVTINNGGCCYPWTGDGRIYGMFYKNKPTAYTSSVPDGSDPSNFYLQTSTGWPPDTSFEYGSYPGHSRVGQFAGIKSFTQSTPGTYTARFFFDNENRVAETNNYTNNQKTVTYTVNPIGTPTPPPGPADLSVGGLELTNSSGVTKTNFLVGEQIYAKLTIQNTGDSDATSGVITQLYKDKSATVPVNTASDIPLTISHGILAKDKGYIYGSYPTGPLNSSFTQATKYWTMPTAGSYTAVAYVNYNNAKPESDYTNNQAPFKYTIGVPTPTPSPTPLPGSFNIIGKIYLDYDQNGIYDSSKDTTVPANWGYELTLTSDSGPYTAAQFTATDNGTGLYSFRNVPRGNYTVSYYNSSKLNYQGTLPSNTPPSYTVSVGDPCVAHPIIPTGGNGTCSVGNIHNLNFGFKPRLTYSVSGNVFVDTNNNNQKDGGTESNYAGSVIINVKDSYGITRSVTQSAGASYTMTGLAEGTYTVSLKSVPSGHKSFPSPASFSVTVGTSCVTVNTTGSSCDGSGNITSLNFALNVGTSWIRANGGNIRFDSGIANPMPVGANCSSQMIGDGTTATPGILYSGDSASSYGSGTISSRNWIAGGSTLYPATGSTSPLKTSYDTMMATVTKNGVTPVDLSIKCANLAACSFSGMASNTVYVAHGNLTPTSAGSFTSFGYNVIFVEGDLNVTSRIGLSNYGAVFIVKGDIIVSPTVVDSLSCNDNTPQLEGIFSTDKSFIVQGASNCPTTDDDPLSIRGSVIVNAARQGGSFVNQRNLCSTWSTYPSVSIVEDPTQLINFPSVLKQQKVTWREVNP